MDTTRKLLDSLNEKLSYYRGVLTMTTLTRSERETVQSWVRSLETELAGVVEVCFRD